MSKLRNSGNDALSHRASAAIKLRNHHNEIIWNSQASTVREALREAWVARAYLEGVNLRGQDLRGLHVPELQIPDCILDDANLQGANLSGTNLHGASLRSTNLQAARLARADLGHADLTGAQLQGAIADRTDMTHATLRGADLRSMNAPQITLRGADLCGADVKNAVLLGAVLTDALFGPRRGTFQCAQLTGTPVSTRRIEELLRQRALERPETMIMDPLATTSDPDNTKTDLTGWILHYGGEAAFALAQLTSNSVAAAILCPAMADMLLCTTEGRRQEMLERCRALGLAESGT